MNYKTVLLLLIVYLVSCQSPLQFYKKYNGKKVTVGTQGGFTGELKKYVLLEDGGMYKTSSLTQDTTFLGNLDDRLNRQIFNNYKVLGLGSIDVSEPGNMNYFIEFNDAENNHKLLWNKSSDIDKKIALFYDFFMSSVKELKKN
ncbi:MAG TPA: hypothetical protein ENK91_09830 [Bacteroidetes bacterium]|nr:hypothetical protein [Bacteroidota bacterium]